jgi:hypothetical protein
LKSHVESSLHHLICFLPLISDLRFS